MNNTRVVADLIRARYETRRYKDRAFIVALQGPQGIGKTTLCASLISLFRQEWDLEVCVVSLDDFYKTHEELSELFRTTRNPLWNGRGLPGTHDVILARDTLVKLANFIDSVSVPKYNKALLEGKGDRCPIEDWPKVTRRPDIVILEGWMLGAKSVGREAIAAKRATSPILQKYSFENLVEMDAALKPYETELYPLFDLTIHLRCQDLNIVYQWRWEQELSLKRSLNDENAGMSEERTREFVDRFMPCYELNLSDLSSQPETLQVLPDRSIIPKSS